MTRTKPIRQISTKKRAEMRAWAKVVAECKAISPYCRIPGCLQLATDGHHMLKRSQGGKNTRGNCLIVCRTHHRWIESYPADAVKYGFSIERRSLGGWE